MSLLGKSATNWRIVIVVFELELNPNNSAELKLTVITYIHI
jgi:hypothetical protein